ncbi:hypothetical protein GCM10023223_05670 [Stackebrandtia albiflava]
MPGPVAAGVVVAGEGDEGEGDGGVVFGCPVGEAFGWEAASGAVEWVEGVSVGVDLFEVDAGVGVVCGGGVVESVWGWVWCGGGAGVGEVAGGFGGLVGQSGGGGGVGGEVGCQLRGVGYGDAVDVDVGVGGVEVVGVWAGDGGTGVASQVVASVGAVVVGDAGEGFAGGGGPQSGEDVALRVVVSWCVGDGQRTPPSREGREGLPYMRWCVG